MSAVERWSEDDFVRIMRQSVIPEGIDDDDEPVNLAAECQNPVISWAEFAGDFT